MGKPQLSPALIECLTGLQAFPGGPIVLDGGDSGLSAVARCMRAGVGRKSHDEILEDVTAAYTVARLRPVPYRKMGGCRLALISLCLCLGLAHGFYLPGVAPQDYAKASKTTPKAPISSRRVGFCILTDLVGLCRETRWS